MAYKWQKREEGGSHIKPFHNLDKEKQNHIINVALKEFADKGFEYASTNQIVKEAEIGKGMLFYYFSSKKKLYYYLIDYALHMIKRKHLDLIDTTEQDLFKRLHQLARTKMSFLKKYPSAMTFMTTVIINDADQIDSQITEKIEALQKKAYEKTFENIDLSLFRSDIDPKKVFQIIRWVFDGFETDVRYRLRGENIREFHFDPYWDEFYHYIDVMRKSFYK